MYLFFLKLVKKIPLLNVAMCLLFSSCSHPVINQPAEQPAETGVREIAVMENISENRKVTLSTVASEIEYCLLETDKKCLVTPYMNVYCTKDYIVTIGSQGSRFACYVFDRKTGKFVRQISRMGQGPDDYLAVLALFWDEKNEQVCVWRYPYHIFYNIDGTISHKINRNENPYSILIQVSVAYDDRYVTYMPNLSGNETKRILFLDKTGALVDSIPNYRTWEKTFPHRGGGIDKGQFYIFNNKLFYIDIFCDTLYHINDFTLQPMYVFNTGGHTLPYKKIHEEYISRYDILASLGGKEIPDRWSNYFVIDKILEDTKYLYFTFDYKTKRYPAIYNKKEDVIQIMPPIAIPPHLSRDRSPLYGFENDLDGGLPFWPQQMISEKEMMCVYAAEELLELDVSKITDAKLKNVLNSLEEDSNPVVAIVTLKE